MTDEQRAENAALARLHAALRRGGFQVVEFDLGGKVGVSADGREHFLLNVERIFTRERRD